MRKYFLIGAALLGVSYIIQQDGRLAFLMPGSNLGMFETRIQGPASELMRRSPELEANFEEYRECRNTPQCDPVSIFADRDTIVKAAWPDVYDRLEIRQDWDICTHTDGCEDVDVQHDFFAEAQAKYGYRLRYDCVPRVVYLERPNGGAVYDTYGYDCPP